MLVNTKSLVTARSGCEPDDGPGKAWLGHLDSINGWSEGGFPGKKHFGRAAMVSR